MSTKVTLDELELLHIIHHVNRLDVAQHLADKLHKAKVNEPEPKRNGYREIADAMGMPWKSLTSIDDVVNYIKELRRDREQDTRNVEYLRAILEEIRTATGLTPGHSTAAVVEQVSLYAISHNVLHRLMKASGFSGSDSVPTMESVMEYRKSVTAAADAIAEDSGLDSAVYLVKMNDQLKSLQHTLTNLRAIIEGVHGYNSQMAWLEALRKAAE